MKKITIAVLVLFTAGSVFAQAGKNNAPAAKTNPHLKVFYQAAQSGDVNTAVSALNYYVAEQGANSAYEDTLAMLYMQQGAYATCYYWADKRSKVKPDDNNLMEMKGICLDKLQQPKEAISIFEKLYSKTQSPYHAYKLMELQYGIKRLAECVATAMSVEKQTFKQEYTMTYNVGEQIGRTYLQAGIFNIHGLALYDLDRKAEARQYFEKAVALDSTFVLARQNIEAMNSIEAEASKTKTGNNPPPASPANKQD
ncbi:MAG TPA: hypothetical protein PLZ45_10395 [Ferruginibacter sp.]|nr:hypothetical protein [Ferruginibacter sp.]